MLVCWYCIHYVVICHVIQLCCCKCCILIKLSVQTNSRQRSTAPAPATSLWNQNHHWVKTDSGRLHRNRRGRAAECDGSVMAVWWLDWLLPVFIKECNRVKCWQALGNHYTLPLTGNVEFWCLVFGTMTEKTLQLLQWWYWIPCSLSPKHPWLWRVLIMLFQSNGLKSDQGSHLACYGETRHQYWHSWLDSSALIWSPLFHVYTHLSTLQHLGSEFHLASSTMTGPDLHCWVWM